jgi:hypothetical protein
MYLEYLELIIFYWFQGPAFWRLDEELARQLHADLNWGGHFEVGIKSIFRSPILVPIEMRHN